MSRAGLKVVAAVSLVVAVAALAVWRSKAGPAQQVAQGPRQSWSEGDRLLYTVSWTAATRGTVAPGEGGATAISMETDVEADVSVTALGERGTSRQLAITCQKVKRFRFRMQEQEVPLDAARNAEELEGRSAFVTVSGRGEVRGIGYSSDAGVPAMNLLHALVQHLQVTLPERQVGEWEARESTSLGVARVLYKNEGGNLTRKRLAYDRLEALRDAPVDGVQDLRGSASLRLDGAQRLTEVREVESLRYTRTGGTVPDLTADWSFTATLRGQDRTDSRPLAAALVTASPVVALAERVRDPQFESRREAQLASGMSEEKLLNEVENHQGGSKPAHDFMVKAGAYLRLHPEMDEVLLTDFRSPARNLKGRNFLLDLLAQAGDEPAQKAMREALSSAQARASSKDFSVLVQHFSFVGRPDAESARFLAGLFSQPQAALTDVQGAAAALGAVVGHCEQSGQPELAREYNARLRDELERSKSPDLQRALLMGLGNAARAENVPVIAAFARSEEPLLRSQAASALRTVASDDARKTLLGLAGDYDTSVSMNALSSLRRQTLAASDWTELRGLVDTQKLNGSADRTLVSLIADNRKASGSDGTAMLEALLKRNGGGENDTGTVIRELLGKDAAAARGE